MNQDLSLKAFMKALKEQLMNLSRQQLLTLRGQALAGDVQGAQKGLATLLRKQTMGRKAQLHMNKQLTLGSLFDGSGGFPLGGMLCGIKPVWASEIEPFPIRVTSRRIPAMKHYGDISTMNGAEIEPVDIITFGSPCTDMSVAGKRAGLDGAQSSLFYQAIRIIREMREATHGKYPRYIVWENVPGAFTSNQGEDFKAVLEAIIGIKEPNTPVPTPEKAKWPYADSYMGDGWSVAYRTLDAQFWGVPQRRKRIYLVADFAGGRAFDILFKSEGLSGYSAESFSAWQRVARSAEDGIGATSLCLNDQGGERIDISNSVSATLRAEAHHPPCVLESAGFCTEHSAQSRGIGYEEEKSPTLRAGVVPGVAIENHPADSRLKINEYGIVQTLSGRMGTGGNNVPLAMAYGICSQTSHAMQSDNPYSGIYEADIARTLDAGGGNPTCNQGGIAVCVQGSMIGRENENGPQGSGINEETAFTLNTIDRHAVAYGIDRAAYNQGENALYNFAVEEELEPTLTARGPGAVSYAMTTGNFGEVHEEQAATLLARDFKDPQTMFVPQVLNQPHYLVRRLTPTECALLQGFPSDWCAGLEIQEPTEDDISFWADVFTTHARINGKKPKTRNQIVKWLRSPHTDSAEYKLWGNGIALPNVAFVLSGIVYYTQDSAPEMP